MKNKLLFRILGALSSSLIIAGIFVPFISVTGFSQSLWQSNSTTGALYLPIMIIVFGAISVILFAINMKIELVYSSTGALIFYLITQTIPIINQGTFKTLGIGYYFLVIGTILSAVFAFLCGIKNKTKIVQEEKIDEQPTEESVLNQIDRLYENPSLRIDESINQLDIIQPIQATSIAQPIQENLVQNGISSIEPQLTGPTISLSDLENSSLEVQPVPEIKTNEQLNEVVNGVNNQVQEVSEIPVISQPIEPSSTAMQTPDVPSAPINPVVSEFSEQVEPPSTATQTPDVPSAPINPVVSEFSQSEEINPVATQIPEVPSALTNPVVSEFSQPVETNPVATQIPDMQAVPSVNPVVSEFNQPTTSQFNLSTSVSNDNNVVENTQEIQNSIPGDLTPLGAEPKVDVMASSSELNKNNSNLDIFN